MTTGRSHLLTCLFAALLLQACQATTPVAEFPEASTSDRFGLVAVLSNEQAEVVSRANSLRHASYTGYQFGAIGGLVEGLMIAGMQGNVIESSLGEPAKSVTITLDRANMEGAFRDHIIAILRKNFAVEPLEAASPFVAGQEGDFTILASQAAEHYRKEARTKGITSVIEIVYRHGLGVYSSQENPAPIIVADVAIIRVADGKMLLKQALVSDAYRKQGYSLQELTEDNNRVYEQEIALASDAVGHLLAAELGFPFNLKEKSYWKNNTLSDHYIR